jgi:hypothetical protein
MVTRVVAESLSQRWTYPVIVERRRFVWRLPCRPLQAADTRCTTRRTGDSRAAEYQSRLIECASSGAALDEFEAIRRGWCRCGICATALSVTELRATTVQTLDSDGPILVATKTREGLTLASGII